MDDYNYKEIELFIREELSQHGEWLVDRFSEALEKNRNIQTGELIDSIDYSTSSVNVDGSIGMTITFLTRGRLMEVAGRRRKQNSANHDIWSTKNHRHKKVAWYNKNRYAGYGRLISRLVAGMSDDELQRIRGILVQAKADFAVK